MESPSMLAPPTDVARTSSSSPVSKQFYVLLKAHFFLFFSAYGVLYPILNITLRSRGLSNTELSYINIIIPFLIFFTNPLSGLIADRLHRHKSTFNIILALTTILYTIIFILPIIKSHNIKADMTYDAKLGHVLDFCASQEVATQCSSRSLCGCSYQANCNLIHPLPHMKTVSFSFTMNSKDVNQNIKDATDVSGPVRCGIQYQVPINKSIQQYTNNRSLNSFRHTEQSSRIAVCEITCSIAHLCHGTRYNGQMLFIILYALLFIAGTNFLTNAIPLGVSIGFAALANPDIFGQQRVFGTIGFGISAFVASRLYGVFQTEFVYIIMFSIITILCIIVTSFIHIQPQKKHRNTTISDDKEMNDLSVKKKKKKSPFQLSSLVPLLKKIDVIVFLSLTFIWGMSYAGLDPYLYLYIDEISVCQSRSVVGWMSLVSAAAEVVALFLAGRVLKLIGTNLASVLILLAFAIRFGGYYYIRQPYFLIPMETMHFFNFGILYVLIVQKTDSIAPPGLSGTLQGVAFGVSFGLGRGVGLVIASFIYTLVQSRLLFLIFAIFNLIAAILYSLYFIFTRQHSKKALEKNDNIAIEHDAKLKEEPLLMVSTKNQSDHQVDE